MLKSNAPTQLTVAFASGSGAGPINTIPIPASGTAGAASWTTGFTTVNCEPIGSGGIAPFGADFNGIFNALSNAQIWEQAGYLYPYSSAFSTAVGGYPAGASLQMASGLGLWINQSDSNTTNPDTTASANWVEMCANGGATSIALTGASVTPTGNQLGVRLLVLTGALSAACKLVLPLRNGASWKILNNTTGGQTVTVGGVTGSIVTIAAGSSGAQEVFTDGTNYYTTSFNGAGVYLPINGNAVSASAWANARTIAMSGDVVWSVSVDGSGNASAAGTIQASAVTLAKMANLTASSLMGNPTGSAATPVAVPLINGITFSSGSLGLGAITPASVASTGAVSGTNLTASGSVTANGVFQSSSTTCILAPTGAGAVYLRPNGQASAVGQMVMGSDGSLTTAGPGNVGVGTSATSVPGLGNPVIGANNIVAYNAGNIGLTLCVDNNARTLQMGFAAAGLSLFAAGMQYNTGTGVLSLWSGAAARTTIDGNGLVVVNTSGASSSLSVVDTGGNGANIKLAGNGSTTPNKWIRAQAGNLQVMSNGYGTILNLDDSGNLTTYGTSANLNASDARVKANFVEREPACIHRLWFGDYDRTDISAHGVGHRAQDVQTVMPHRVHAYDDIKVPGTDQAMLVVDQTGMALEQGIWCGREIDNLWLALKVAGIERVH